MLAEALRGKIAGLRALPGESGKTARFTGSELEGAASLNLEGNEERNDFIKVDGKYFKLDDPLPCAELGAQSRASGSAYNEFGIVDVDAETTSIYS